MRDKINYLKKFSLEMFTAVLACVKCLLGKFKKKNGSNVILYFYSSVWSYRFNNTELTGTEQNIKA